MVYKFDLRDTEFLHNKETNYHSIFTREERDTVVNIYSRGTNMELYDGCSIRLDSISKDNDKTTLAISKVSFYDFIATNVLLEKYDIILKKCSSKYEEELVTRLKNRIDEDEVIECIDLILSRNYLSNVLAISIVLEDREGNVLLVKRGANVAVASNIVGVSVTGVIDESDYEAKNPFLNCALREIKEELGIEVAVDDVCIHSLVAGTKRLQPVVLCNVVYDGLLSDILSKLHKTDDFYKENKQAMILTKEELKKSIDSFVLTEAGEEHLRIVKSIL